MLDVCFVSGGGGDGGGALKYDSADDEPARIVVSLFFSYANETE